MKKILLICLIIQVSSSLFAQLSESSKKTVIYSPNFLVHNQLTPEMLKIEYTSGMSSGNFENSIGKQVGHLNQSAFSISGYPISIINKKETQVYAGFGYTRINYSSFEGEADLVELQSPLQSINLNAFANTRIANRLYWSTYVQIGLQGSEPFSEIQNSHNEVIMTKMNFKSRNNFNVGIGLVYVSNLGDPLVIPALAVVYSNKKYVINVDLPVKAEIEGILSRGRLRPVAGVALPGSTYYVKQSNSYINTSGISGYIGVRYRILNALYAYAGWHQLIDESYATGSRGNLFETGSLSDLGQFRFSLNIQVSKQNNLSSN